MDDTILTAGNRLGRRVPRLEVRGRDEGEILALAPALVCDRIHWDSEQAMSAAEVAAALPYDAWSRQWSDGQHRVWVPQGAGEQARRDIAQWCADHGIAHQNMRVELGVPFRDVDAIPDGLFGELVMAAVDWLFPRSFAIRRKLMADLDVIDDEDVRSMMYLFVSDHADRYDADRLGRNGSLTFLVFMLGKLRKWPQDAARTAYGRTAMDDELRFRRLDDELLATMHRPATDADLAAATQTTIADVRRRRQAVTTIRALRMPRPLVVTPEAEDADAIGVHQLALATEEATCDASIERATAHALTRAVLEACIRTDGRGGLKTDPLALACTYLSFWGERSRQEVAEQLGVMPKTVGAAVTRAVATLGQEPAVRDLRD